MRQAGNSFCDGADANHLRFAGYDSSLQFLTGIHLYISLLFLLLLLAPFAAESLSSDGVTLLQIKSKILSDPLGLLYDWNEDDTDPCSWTGVTCDPHSLRVTSLNITGEAFCTAASGPHAACSDGLCNPFQSCPSLLWQSVDMHCSPNGIFSPLARDFVVCLRNGAVLRSGSHYDRRDRVPCRLTGSLSPAVRNLSSLQVLSLGFNGLSGVFPTEIGEIKSLRVIDIRGNFFSGRIPAKIGLLSRLEVLNMAFNSFEGEIPAELSGCVSLQVLDLSGNLLSGKIPAYVGDYAMLQSLRLSYNQLDGIIPEDVAKNCGSLQQLHLEGNFLFGRIPSVLGNCTNLRSLTVSSNFLSAPIPSELGKLHMLESLDVSRNSFGGDVPPELGNCTKLSLLVLTNLLDVESCINRTMVDPVDGYTSKDKGEFNYFTGSVPASISSLPYLRILWAPRAGFLADFPSQWGSCESLEALNLADNYLSGNIPLELGRCKNLIYLDVSFNSLEGSIPQEFPVHCMLVFNVRSNFLSGTVLPSDSDDCPSSELLWFSSRHHTLYMDLRHQTASTNTVFFYFGTLYRGSVMTNLSAGLSPKALLVVHDLSQNNFTGPIPVPFLGTGLRSTRPSYGYFVSRNQFLGYIPPYLFSMCNYLEEFSVTLSNNFLKGSLFVEPMFGCPSLKHLDASSNQLSGKIPPEIESLKDLVYLDLGANRLHGFIPPELGHLQSLEYLILKDNTLAGTIPLTFGSLTALRILDLSQNKLTGEIPKELANLRYLKHLMLNNNSLSGWIPQGLANIVSRMGLNVAYNNLSGSVPRVKTTKSFCDDANFVGNPYLHPCTALAPAPSSEGAFMPRPFETSPPNTITRRRKSQMNWWLVGVIVAASTLVLVPLFLAFCYFLRKHWCGNTEGKKEVVVFVNTGFHLTYENVVRATGNFSVDNLIGNGGFGATYKAELAPGCILAVKKLYIGRFQGMQQFVAEIRTLERIKHPHLVTLLGYYASDSEMFLIYNYLPGGNLETLLHNGKQDRISWKIRHKIALNVAQALNYLHNGCHTRVLHRDIKPSNILLDTSLNAFLSDFGLARLLGVSETHATTDVAGTFGYVAPEYALTGRVSDKADVYSYGVVLLELLSGKKALDPSFSEHGDGFNIVAWAANLYKLGRNEAIFAQGLWEQGPRSELVEILKLAIMCTEESLAERPTMKQVVECLKLCQVTSA